MREQQQRIVAEQRMEAEQRERREREAAALRRKEKHDCSANASSEVKQKLQVCIL